MIDAIEENLKRGVNLLNSISDEQYANSTIPPYFSSIGCHIRHILDVFSCVINGFDNNHIDLTSRERNMFAQEQVAEGLAYFTRILHQLKSYTEEDLAKTILVSDDLGMGKVTATSTLKAVLMQAQSHAIHHYASIAYIIYQLGIELPDASFGFNPTTPKNVLSS